MPCSGACAQCRTSRLPARTRPDALESLRALLLNIISPGAGGTHEDTSAGRAHLATVVDHLGSLAGVLPAGAGDPAVWGRAFALYTRVIAAGETEDVHMLRELVAEAEALEESVPEDEPFRCAVLWALGAAVARLGIVTGDRTTVLRALPHIEAGHAGMSALPFADELPLPPLPDLDLLRAGLGGDPAPVHEHVPVPPDAAPEELHTAALDLALRFSLTRDPALLDALIGQLERVRDRVREGRAPRIAADALWKLAQAYRERGVLKDDVTDIAALEAAKEALTALAADVLLQAGAEHGLLAARSGANRGVQAALWAASQGRLHDAVAVLELGRALVLHAASTSSAVPDLLEAAGGHHELAEQWRAARRAAGDGEVSDAGTGTGGDGVPGRMPSSLRRRALEALGYRDEDGLLGTPSLGALSDGLADSGADALLYLVPGEGENPGVVLVVAPRLGAAVGVAPLLSGAGSGPLESYLDATAARDAAAESGRPADPSAERTWDEALAALCDWAHQVLDPVLGGVRAKGWRRNDRRRNGRPRNSRRRRGRGRTDCSGSSWCPAGGSASSPGTPRAARVRPAGSTCAGRRWSAMRRPAASSCARCAAPRGIRRRRRCCWPTRAWTWRTRKSRSWRCGTPSTGKRGCAGGSSSCRRRNCSPARPRTCSRSSPTGRRCSTWPPTGRPAPAPRSRPCTSPPPGTPGPRQRTGPRRGTGRTPAC